MRAIQCRADFKGDHYVLNGRKLWITNGINADIAQVVARVVQVVQVGMMGSGDRTIGSLNPARFHHHTHMTSNQNHHTHMIQPSYPYDPTIIPI